MFKGTTENFRQFHKLFRHFISNSEPQLHSNITKNFAYGQFKHDDHFKTQQFYSHVITAVDQLLQSFNYTSSKAYTIPCLFTSFQLVNRGSSQTLEYGDVNKTL